MTSKYIFFTIYFIHELFCLSVTPYHELDIDKSQKYKKVDMNEDNTLYIVSKDTISGVFTYDMDSPVPLNLSFGFSDSKDSLPASFEEGHTENITVWKTEQGYNYFFSYSIQIKNDNRYVFLKISCVNDTTCIDGDDHINVKLNPEYSWKITLIVLFVYIIIIGAIIAICYFARNCLTKCCNFMDKKPEEEENNSV